MLLFHLLQRKPLRVSASAVHMWPALQWISPVTASKIWGRDRAPAAALGSLRCGGDSGCASVCVCASVSMSVCVNVEVGECKNVYV